jgi:GNAT superfamily N-acetyltransferase
MENIHVKKIRAEETYHLRQSILRPMQSMNEMNYEGDHDPGTIHLGAFVEDELIGIVSLFNHPMPESTDKNQWRFRNMAVKKEYQNNGIGKILFKYCIDEAKAAGAATLWCNARTPVEKFYEKNGMERVSDEFIIEPIGPHVIMKMNL